MDRQISTTLWTRSTGHGCGDNVEQRHRLFGGTAPAPSKMAPSEEAGLNLHIVGRPRDQCCESARENRPYGRQLRGGEWAGGAFEYAIGGKT